MKQILIITLMLAIFITPLAGCSYSNPDRINDSPPINVNISSGNITSGGAITQNVVADPHNSSTSNLTAGATFTGTSTSTLNIVGIQVSLKTDQNCTVYVDQSPDGLNWDINDTYNYVYSLGGNSWTVQAVNSYVRVRVKNNNASTATTYFRLQTALCPIVEAVPRSLNEDGRFKTSTTIRDQYGFVVEDTPMGEMRVVEPVKLVGAIFTGTTVDTNFWQTNLVGSGNITQSGGNMVITTGATANSTASVSSVRRGRYVAGASMRYRATVMQSAFANNNVRRWGVTDWVPTFAVTDGAYFKITNNTFGVAYMSGSMETDAFNGTFNGLYGTTYTLDTNYHTYEIYYTNTRLYYVIDGIVLHTVTCTNFNWTSTSALYLWADNRNSNGGVSNVTETIKVQSIYRLGALNTAPIFKHITTATTTVCKYGAGTLHSIVVNNPTNNAITVYDNITAGGTVIAVIDPDASATPFYLPYKLEFSTGLTIVTSGGTPDLTVIYE